MTPGALITLILKTAQINGVGQTPSAEDSNDMLAHLNLLIGQWSTERTMVYHLVNTAISVTGASSYTVGTGGNFSTTRPDKIDSAFYTYTGTTPNTDYVLSPIGSREEWNAVVLKNVGTWPSMFFYDSGYPLGAIYPYPIPTSGTLTISTKEALAQFADLVTDIAFPPAYLNALMWNGASIARTVFGSEPDPSTDRRAAGSLEVIRAANFQVPLLRMPAGIPGAGSRYNIFSDSGGAR